MEVLKSETSQRRLRCCLTNNEEDSKTSLHTLRCHTPDMKLRHRLVSGSWRKQEAFCLLVCCGSAYTARTPRSRQQNAGRTETHLQDVSCVIWQTGDVSQEHETSIFRVKKRCDAMKFGRYVPTFRRNLLFPSSGSLQVWRFREHVSQKAGTYLRI